MKKLFDYEGWQVWSEEDDLECMRDSGIYKETFFWCHDPLFPGVERIACFRLIPFPWNCGIVVSVTSEIEKSFRGKGLAKRFHKIKEKVAREFGYSAMICTVEGRNLPQLISASNSGWTFEGFRNNRMGTYNYIGVKFL
jgi:hypothetical protein